MATTNTTNSASTSTSTSADNKELMIVKKPKEDDVLLGQGHYRHPGNQKLNKIVDARVNEYKNQSRPFKTYMAHDIIHSLRNKGVRFLKELRGGWIIVKDDKEAREKVAQRFQYMMRKQADNPFVAAQTSSVITPKQPANQKAVQQPSPLSSSTASATATTSSSSAEATPSPQPNLIWNGSPVKLPFLPVFHQLQKTSVMVDDDINEVSRRLLDCFSIIGVQERFNHEQANAVLTLPENLKIQMNLWKPLGGNCGLIVELVSMEGDHHQVFQKYSRYILEAATGLFQKYSHTLFQSGRLATASVQDYVSTFTPAPKPDNKKAPLPGAPGNKMNPEEARDRLKVKPGMVKAMSDRSLQASKDKAKAFESSPTKKKALTRAAPSVKRLDQSRIPPMVPSKEAKKAVPEIKADKVSMTGSFASAFSRWETGIGMPEQNTEAPAARHISATPRRPSLPTTKGNVSSSSASHSVWEPYPYEAVIAQPSTMNFDTTVSSGPMAKHFLVKPAAAPVKASTRIEGFHANDRHVDGRPTLEATTSTTADTKVANSMWAMPLPNVMSSATNETNGSTAMPPDIAHHTGPSSRPHGGAQGSGELTYKVANPSSEPIQRQQEEEKPHIGVGCDGDIHSPEILANTANNTEMNGQESRADGGDQRELSCDDATDLNTPVPMVAWATVEEMKCDNSVDEKMDSEMFSIGNATESIKRLSISSNEASFCEARTTRDFNEAYPVGVWPVAYSIHQEMKCDGSWEEGFTGEDLLSPTQSFIPTAFFGSTLPNTSTLRVPNPPSPAHSFCSHISVEMRSVPSPSPSPSITSNNGEAFSLPSPSCSFNSKCSIGMGSLKNARMDESISPSMFNSDQSSGNAPEHHQREEFSMLGAAPSHDSVPPTIFVDSSHST